MVEIHKSTKCWGKERVLTKYTHRNGIH